MTEIRVEVGLDHPPARVWRALTERGRLAEWFMETDFVAEPGAVFQLRPVEQAGFDGPIEVTLEEVVEPRQLAMRWQADQLHSQVVWQLEPTAGGCRFRMTQTGFLGVSGTRRRAQLRQTYQQLFVERLPAALDRMAAAEAEAGSQVGVLQAGIKPVWRPVVPATPATRPGGVLRWLRARWRLVALTALGVLVAMLAGALISLWSGRGGDPAGAGRPGAVEGLAPGQVPSQAAIGAPGATGPAGGPGAGPSNGASGAPPAGPGLPAPGQPTPITGPAPGPAVLTAAYRLISSPTLGLSYTGRITVRNGGASAANSWVVRITLPALATVTAASGAGYEQRGTSVTFTPTTAGARLAPGEEAVIQFDVLLAVLGPKEPLTCDVNGTPCTGLSA